MKRIFSSGSITVSFCIMLLMICFPALVLCQQVPGEFTITPGLGCTIPGLQHRTEVLDRSSDPTSAPISPEVCANIDVGIWKRLSVGFCGAWQTMGYGWSGKPYMYVSNGPNATYIPDLTWTDTYVRWNISTRVLWHFFEGRKFDMYSGVRWGRTWWTRHTTNPDPNYNYGSLDLFRSMVNTDRYWPQAVFGMRFAFDKYMSFNVENAIGDPYFLLIGITLRFNGSD